MSAYWIMEVIPLASIAFFPFFLLPLLCILPIDDVAAAYLTVSEKRAIFLSLTLTLSLLRRRTLS